MPATEAATMASFLMFSGALAIIVGLVAVIEGNLHCFALMRRKKSLSCSPR
jgi:hypothetical protein